MRKKGELVCNLRARTSEGGFVLLITFGKEGFLFFVSLVSSSLLWLCGWAFVGYHHILCNF